MQDGIPPHITYETIAYLEEIFYGYLRGFDTEHEWSLHNRDLQPVERLLVIYNGSSKIIC